MFFRIYRNMIEIQGLSDSITSCVILSKLLKFWRKIASSLKLGNSHFEGVMGMT